MADISSAAPRPADLLPTRSAGAPCLSEQSSQAWAGEESPVSACSCPGQALQEIEALRGVAWPSAAHQPDESTTWAPACWLLGRHAVSSTRY